MVEEYSGMFCVAEEKDSNVREYLYAGASVELSQVMMSRRGGLGCDLLMQR
jgi:hypothetical protein